MAQILMIVLFGLLIQTVRPMTLANMKKNNTKPPIQARKITIATVKDSAPFVTRSGNAVPCGFDIDLMNAIGLLYAVEFQYSYTTFDKLIPAVQADENTISISTQTITAEREKSVVFAQYFRTGSAFLVKSTSNLKITGLSDLCGLKVAVQTGTTQEQDVKNQKCTKPITIISFPNYSDLVAKVKDGSADVAVSDEALFVTSASVKNSGVKVVGKAYDVAPYGIACNLKASALCCDLVNAINVLIGSGTYNNILNRYSFNYKNNGVCPSRLNLEESVCDKTYEPSAKYCAKELA